MFAGITLLLVPLCVVQIFVIEKHCHTENVKNIQINSGERSPAAVSSRRRFTRTLHIIHCLSGNDPYFIDEWEIGLRSILVNAPVDSHLHVHLIADNDASVAIDERIIRSGIENSAWRNEISVILHNVHDLLPSWRLFLSNALTSVEASWMDNRVGIGGYLRLLAHRVVVPYECNGRGGCVDHEKRDLEQALYADTDVVIIGNLNNLMHTISKVLDKKRKEGKDRPLWIWNQNSGFIVMNLLTFEKVWELAATIPNEIKNSREKMKGDQWLLAKVQNMFPNITAIMPEQWSTHVGHGFRRSPQRLYDQRKQGTGMLHFTMPSHFGKNWLDMGGTDKWCKFSRSCNETAVEPGGDMDKVRKSWGLAEYYAKLSWDWAIYQGGTSMLRPGESNTLKYIKMKWLPDSDGDKSLIQEQYSPEETKKQLDKEYLRKVRKLRNFCEDNKWLPENEVAGTQEEVTISCKERVQYLVGKYNLSEQKAKISIFDYGCECRG